MPKDNKYSERKSLWFDNFIGNTPNKLLSILTMLYPLIFRIDAKTGNGNTASRNGSSEVIQDNRQGAVHSSQGSRDKCEVVVST